MKVTAELHDGSTRVLEHRHSPFDRQRAVLYDDSGRMVLVRPSDSGTDPEYLIEFLSALSALARIVLRVDSSNTTNPRKPLVVAPVVERVLSHDSACVRREREGTMAVTIKDIMTPRNVSEETGYSIRTVYDWVEKQQIKHRRTKSGRIRILRQDLLEFLGCTPEEARGDV